MTEKTIAQKMHLHNASAVAVLNAEGGSAALLAALPAQRIVADGVAADLVLLFAPGRRELEDLLPHAKSRLAPKGALWVAYVKGTSKRKSDVHRDTIRDFAVSIGLASVAMISVDGDWSCLRLKAVCGPAARAEQ